MHLQDLLKCLGITLDVDFQPEPPIVTCDRLLVTEDDWGILFLNGIQHFMYISIHLGIFKARFYSDPNLEWFLKLHLLQNIS